MSRGGKQPLLALSQRCNLVALRQLVAKALKSASKSNTQFCAIFIITSGSKSLFQKAAASAKWHQAEVARLRSEREQRLSGDFEVII